MKRGSAAPKPGARRRAGIILAKIKYRAPEWGDELESRQVRPDTRTLTRKAKDFFGQTDGVVAAMMAFPLAAMLLIKVPLSGEMLAGLMWLFYAVYVRYPVDKEVLKKRGVKAPRKRFDFPYRVPFFAKLLDGSYEQKKLGEGITFLGKEISSKLEIWTGNSDLRTHMLVLGTTGSGKTEFLLGLVYNALVQNSGFIYTDGKGDVSLFNNVFRLARYVGREDDILTVNFLTSGRDFLDKQKDRTTNTMNPFALGSSGMLIELIVALMDDSGGGGDMWKGRAIAFTSGQTRALCFLRDRGYLLLDSNTFIQYMELPVIERMVWDRTISVDGKEIKITDPLFDKVLKGLEAYLLTLPGYKREAKGAQEQKTIEQHGFITMQLTRLFGDMSFTYGYLFQTTLGDVDMYDVVINRRILVVLLPALERAPDSLRMLGKLIVGAIKQMMAGCLGNRLEGAVREIVDARPTNSAVPFYVVLDEYGYYAVKGFAVAPAQARSLGFSITFAAQDFSSLQKESKEEADATWENTNIRAVGRIVGGEESETFRRIKGVAGETLVQQGGGKEYRQGDVSGGYVTVRDTRPERVRRIEYDDLAQQENGEFAFLIGKKSSGGRGGVRVVRARTFYTATDERPTHVRVNHFIKIEPPKTGDADQELEVIDALESSLKKMLESGDLSKVFPNNPLALAGKNQPLTLLQTATYMREAMSDHRLSMGDAARVALVCAEKEIEVQQQAKLRELEARQAAASADELSSSVNSLRDAAPGTGGVSDYLDDDEGGQDGEETTSGSESATSGKSGASGAKGGSGGGPGGVTLTPSPSPVATTQQPSLGSLIGEFLDGYEEESGGGGDAIGEGGEDGVQDAQSSDESKRPQVSVLTLRPIGEGEEPNEISSYMETKIADADVLIGVKKDVLAIKADAKEEVKEMEKSASYVDGTVPEPATLETFDDLLVGVVDAAERNLDIFD